MSLTMLNVLLIKTAHVLAARENRTSFQYLICISSVSYLAYDYLDIYKYYS